MKSFIKDNSLISKGSANLVKILFSSLLLVSFISANAKEYKVITASSTLAWEAKKVTGQHNGTITIADGT